MGGNGEPSDLDILQELGEIIKTASRCGLGQTSPNPILTTLKNFRSVYESLVHKAKDGLQPSFDINSALSDSRKIVESSRRITGRESVHFSQL